MLKWEIRFFFESLTILSFCKSDKGAQLLAEEGSSRQKSNSNIKYIQTQQQVDGRINSLICPLSVLFIVFYLLCLMRQSINTSFFQ